MSVYASTTGTGQKEDRFGFGKMENRLGRKQRERKLMKDMIRKNTPGLKSSSSSSSSKQIHSPRPRKKVNFFDRVKLRKAMKLTKKEKDMIALGIALD